ncbi:MAG: hypothetical protein BWZ08_02849 [candidate division BRC1 bacterium ADurb.BinA292]|nr:MAG: hypothetical protein BWZ08_02849 [candidate division BRC1 bacterium ADurb.BinA292]
MSGHAEDMPAERAVEAQRVVREAVDLGQAQAAAVEPADDRAAGFGAQIERKIVACTFAHNRLPGEYSRRGPY